MIIGMRDLPVAFFLRMLKISARASDIIYKESVIASCDPVIAETYYSIIFQAGITHP